MTPIPVATHVFLLVVPLAFALGALTHYVLRGHRER